MPMLLAGGKPDPVARPNLLDRFTPPLHPACSEHHNQSLPQGMRMPRRASARLERDAGAGRARWIGGLKQRIDPHGAGEPVGWTLARGLRTGAFDVHGAIVTGGTARQ